MFRKLILATLLVAVAGVANAAEPKARGAYVGVSTGLATFDDDGLVATFGGFIDDEDTSVQIYGGYKFFKYFAVEGRYIELGSYSDGIDSLDITAISVHAVGIVPFGQSGWEIFGQLGLAQVTQDFAGFAEEDDNAGSAGLGVRWHIGQHFALAAQVDAYVWENDDTGILFDWSVTTTQVAFQFNF